MKYFNVIGDIHGRRIWERLVCEDRINIFVGDYFDPYDRYDFEYLKENFLNIIKYADEHPGKVIMLLGNHDLHYFHFDDYSRLDESHVKEIQQLFLDNIDKFHGVAYAINNKVLVSHSGVTKPWLGSTDYFEGEKLLYNKRGQLTNEGDFHAKPLEDWVNSLLWDGFTWHDDQPIGWEHWKELGLRHFTFREKCDYFDYYGTTKTQSPVWVRPTTLLEHNAMEDIEGSMQIVGHTQVFKIIATTHINDEKPRKIILVDCLGQDEPASLFVNLNEETDTCTYEVNLPH